MKPILKYSILIPTKNNIHFTERCLLSLLDNFRKENIKLDEFEVLFLDSGSIDGLHELVKHYRGVNLRILDFNTDNFSNKNNIGAKQAKGQYLILLNNDTEVLENLVRPMEDSFKDPTVGVVSNKHFFPSMLLNHVGIAYRDDKSPVHLYPNEHDKYSFTNKSRKVPAVTAACAMLKREEFLKVGGFDEKYVYGYEDVDLCLKFKKELNKDCFVAIDSKIIHFGQSSWGRDRGENANRAYFLEKWKDEPLKPFHQIYKEDGYDFIKKKERYSKAVFRKIKNILRCDKSIQPEKDYELNEKTIVFFYDDVFNSFNVVIRNLYESFKESFSSEYTVLKDSPSNFSKYYSSKAKTVTWTHFWDQYFVKTRENPNLDFRLFAINYEYHGDISKVDYWTKHIKESKFHILSISEYCSDFLKNVGVENERISLLNLGYWNEFRNHSTIPEVNSKPRYMVITNTNDPDRYGTDIAIESISKAFADKKENIEVIIKDYGGNTQYVSDLIQKYLNGFEVELSKGYLSNDDLALLYLKGDVLVNPFRGEGFGMKILEAGVSGLVTIAPLYGGPKDFLEKMAHIPVEFSLEEIGNTIDKKLLFLNNCYFDCNVNPNDLVDKIKYSFENLHELKRVASQKAQALRDEFCWEKVVTNLSTTINSKSSNIKQKRFEKYNIAPSIVINKLNDIDASIIINTYNRPEQLQEAINAYLNLPDIEHFKIEIVVVNDGSQIDYENQINEFKNIEKIQLKYIHYKDNKGNSFSKNVGLYNAEGEVSFFVGDDIIPLPGFILRRIETHREDPYKLILGHTEWHPSIRNNLIAEFAVKYSAFQFGYEIFRNCDQIFGANLYTSNISFVTEKVRSKDLYFEDIDKIVLYEDAMWGLRLEEHGFKLIYDRKIEALHNHQVNYKWFKERSKIIGATGARIFKISPDSIKFTSAKEFIDILRHNFDDFTSKEIINDNSMLIDIENHFERVITDLILIIESTNDYKLRSRYLTLLHNNLFLVNRFYMLYGFLEEFDLLDRYKELLFEISFTYVNIIVPGRPSIKQLLQMKFKEYLFKLSKKYIYS